MRRKYFDLQIFTDGGGDGAGNGGAGAGKGTAGNERGGSHSSHCRLQNKEGGQPAECISCRERSGMMRLRR